MRSLKPTKSYQFHARMVAAWRTFNKNQRIDNQPQLSFKQWAYTSNIDLSGRTVVDLNRKF